MSRPARLLLGVARAAAVIGIALAAANWLAVWILEPRPESLPADATVDVAERGASLADLARRHLPSIHDDPALPAGPLREVLWEARRAPDGTIEILYRTVWNDEVHPVPWIDVAYRLFRRFYFGTAIDVEYVLVAIDGRTGEVAALDYQTEPSGRRDVTTSAHARVHETRPRTPIDLRVVTWNHMVGRLEGPADAVARGLVRAAPTLRPVTDEDRRRLWLARATYSYLEGFGAIPAWQDGIFFGAALVLAVVALLAWRARRA